ncbi:type II toxin-antitoxin system PemK/MazF family toxin [Brevundimonas sp. BAL450]|jgi:mRNA interferase MazF|uniref:type II toxin-antitoxin system PemK/MazF family toxin n=1 Tax=Brevundimonas TaxID=41275 RepID=UPI0009DDE23F|nr:MULTISPECIES: type II toxin-antitoxin system PemK/MazF family toxin [Brevundimonas]MBG7614958.1 type II toxin-antitoxin system PemK/MazF family toxin [Brevundimonas sp. BAL450]
MPIFEPGDIVRAPFPYTDRNTEQHRPALVVSSMPLGPAGRLVWILMITSAENRPWDGDVSFGDDYGEAGLPAPSVIRTAKIATVETGRLSPIGRAPPIVLSAVHRRLDAILTLPPGDQP